MTLLTPSQARIKKSLGLFHDCNVHVRFHWKFWSPVECVGGKVYIGYVWEVWHPPVLKENPGPDDEMLYVQPPAGSRGFLVAAPLDPRLTVEEI